MLKFKTVITEDQRKVIVLQVLPLYTCNSRAFVEYSLPDDKNFRHASKSKAFADDESFIELRWWLFFLRDRKTWWEKKNMLVTSIFFFFHNVLCASFGKVVKNWIVLAASGWSLGL